MFSLEKKKKKPLLGHQYGRRCIVFEHQYGGSYFM